MPELRRRSPAARQVLVSGCGLRAMAGGAYRTQVSVSEVAIVARREGRIDAAGANGFTRPPRLRDVDCVRVRLGQPLDDFLGVESSDQAQPLDSPATNPHRIKRFQRV